MWTTHGNCTVFTAKFLKTKNHFIAKWKICSKRIWQICSCCWYGYQISNFILVFLNLFIFILGSDRNLSSSILEHRAELLSSMVRFFHCDIQTMSDQFVNTDDHYKNLSDKLYHTFETILPILQYNGNVFQNMPISRLPKV